MNQRPEHLSTESLSANIKYKGREVDPKKLRRQAKMETRSNLTAAQADAFPSPSVSLAAKV
jgi:hypothetical protein